MKKIIATFALISAIILSSTSIAKADDKVVGIDTTPQKVRTFIALHFKDLTVSHVTKDWDSYDVYLSNGTELEFSSNGHWKSIDVNRNVMPLSVTHLLPVKAKEYLEQNYKEQKIEKISKENSLFKVEFSGANDIELGFDKNGKLVRIDD